MPQSPDGRVLGFKKHIWKSFAVAPTNAPPHTICLCYHAVGRGDPYTTVTWPAFKRQIDCIRRRGLAFVSIGEIAAGTVRTTGGVALTFDDGRADFTDVAEFLNARTIPAALAVPGALLDDKRPSEFGSDIQFLSCAEIEMLARMPGITILPHGYSHHDLTLMSAGEMHLEIERSTALVTELLGTTPEAYVYPFGAHSAPVVKAVSQIGVRAALTITGGVIDGRGDPMRLPRFCINAHTPHEFFELILTPGLRAYLVARNWLRLMRPR